MAGSIAGLLCCQLCWQIPFVPMDGPSDHCPRSSELQSAIRKERADRINSEIRRRLAIASAAKPRFESGSPLLGEEQRDAALPSSEIDCDGSSFRTRPNRAIDVPELIKESTAAAKEDIARYERDSTFWYEWGKFRKFLLGFGHFSWYWLSYGIYYGIAGAIGTSMQSTF